MCNNVDRLARDRPCLSPLELQGSDRIVDQAHDTDPSTSSINRCMCLVRKLILFDDLCEPFQARLNVIPHWAPRIAYITQTLTLQPVEA